MNVSFRRLLSLASGAERIAENYPLSGAGGRFTKSPRLPGAVSLFAGSGVEQTGKRAESCGRWDEGCYLGANAQKSQMILST